MAYLVSSDVTNSSHWQMLWVKGASGQGQASARGDVLYPTRTNPMMHPRVLLRYADRCFLNSMSPKRIFALLSSNHAAVRPITPAQYPPLTNGPFPVVTPSPRLKQFPARPPPPPAQLPNSLIWKTFLAQDDTFTYASSVDVTNGVVILSMMRKQLVGPVNFNMQGIMLSPNNSMAAVFASGITCSNAQVSAVPIVPLVSANGTMAILYTGKKRAFTD